MNFTVIKQSISALRANPVRTALTTLGIVIGIATVILVLSAGAGFRSLIDAQLEAYGTNTLYIQTQVPPSTKKREAGNTANQNEGSFNGVTITTLKMRDLEAINELPNVAHSYGMVIGQAVTSYENVRKNAFYYGASSERFEIDQQTLQSGRFYTKAEDEGAAQVVILGSQIAEDLFGNDEPLGKLVRVGNLNFQVIGVYNPQGDLEGQADDALYIPLVTAQKKLLGIEHIAFAIVQVEDINQADITSDDIRYTLRDSHNITDPSKDDFSVQTQEEALASFNTIFGGLTALLVSIAAISLIVGGVGIMNIMYVVVTERTGEIGLKKAIGATNKDILREFLTESVMVTLLGGVMGIAFGALLGWLVSVIAQSANLAWTFSVPLYGIALACGVSAAIGIGFGVFPAMSAAKLNPIEALRKE